MTCQMYLIVKLYDCLIPMLKINFAKRKHYLDCILKKSVPPKSIELEKFWFVKLWIFGSFDNRCNN